MSGGTAGAPRTGGGASHTCCLSQERGGLSRLERGARLKLGSSYRCGPAAGELWGEDATESENQMANHMEIMKTDEITSPLL